jgi:hypothetical protein
MILFGLGLLELAFLGVFFLLLIIGAALDRRGESSPKWWVTGIGGVVIAAYFWKDFTLATLWADVQTFAFWKPFALYLIAGVLYSVVEFALNVKRARTFLGDAWSSALKSAESKLKVDELTDAEATGRKQAFVARFLGDNRRAHEIVAVTSNDGLTIEPVVNKKVLADHISAWTLFWPFYLIALVVGDLFVEIFNLIAELFHSLSARIVKLSFGNLFKF